MEPRALWIIALSVAAPIAGVVGFALQLRQVKKTRLENEKLQLEIAALRAVAAASDKRIVQVTTEEVQHFTTKDTRFSRGVRQDAPLYAREKKRPALKDNALLGLLIAGLLLVVGYFLYDIYRLAVWLGSKF